MQTKTLSISLIATLAFAGLAWIVLDPGTLRDGGAGPGLAGESDGPDPAVYSGEGARASGPERRILAPGERREQLENPGQRRFRTSGELPVGSASLRARFSSAAQPLVAAEVELRGTTAGHSFGMRKLRKTDAKGRIQAKDLPAGEYRFHLRGKGVPRGYKSAKFTLAEGEQKELGEILVPRGASVTASILTKGGAPLRGAKLRLISDGLMDFVTPRDANGDPIRSLEGVSDVRGQLRVEDIAPGSYTVTVDHAEHLRFEKRVDLKEGQDLSLGSIELETGQRLEGVVVDERGRGIEGAEITPQQSSLRGSSRVTGYAESRRVKSGKNGRFTLGGLRKPVRLQVVAKGYETLLDHAVDLDGSPVRIELRQGCSLIGRVIAEGAELAKCQVYIRRSSPTEARGGFRILRGPSSDQCDEKGEFRFDGLEPGRFSVRADLPGFGVAKLREIHVPARGLSGLQLKLERGPDLLVRVQDPAGKAIEGAVVTLVEGKGGTNLDHSGGLLLGAASSGARRSQRSSAAGEARFTGLWRPSATLSVRADEFLSVEGRPVALSAAGDAQTVTITLDRGGWIEGLCLDSNGKPLPGTRVIVRKPKQAAPRSGVRVKRREVRIDGNFSREIRSDQEGKFRSHPLAPGAYEVLLANPQRATKVGNAAAFISLGEENANESSRVDVQVRAGAGSKVTLRRPITGTVRGRVFSRGVALPKARVILTSKGGDAFAAKETESDATGAYELGNLEPGVFLLTAKPEKHGIPADAVELRIPAGGGVQVKDLAVGGAVVRGKATRASGRYTGLVALLQKAGVAEQVRKMAMMVADSDGGTPKMTTMTVRPPAAPEPVPLSKDGAFEFRFVPEGEWALVIQNAEETKLAQKWIDVPKDQLLDVGKLDLPETWPVKLLVQDSSGQAVSIGSIDIRRKPKGDEKQGESVYRGLVRNGVCEIPGLPSGDFELSFTRIQINGEGPPAKPQKGELRVDARGRVQGSTLRIQ